MEYFDICDENGRPTEEVVAREVAHQEGILHRTAHVWVIRRKPEGVRILLQKRSLEKDSYPGLYDTSSAGHIPAGAEPLESAIRELSEELGIEADASQLHFAGTFRIQYEETFHDKPFRDNEFSTVYVYEEPVKIKNLKLQESEVSKVKWFDLDTVRAELPHRPDRFCVPPESLEILVRYLTRQKLALFFPGIGYTVDKPLLHYSRKLVQTMGYTIRLLPYTGFPKKDRGNTVFMEESFQIALMQAREMLADVDFSAYEEVLFVGKSIGTAVAAQIASEHPEIQKARFLLYTPLENTFTYALQDAVVFTGSADPWVGEGQIPALCQARDIPCHVISDGNHSLECGDVARDIHIVKKVMAASAKFLSTAKVDGK